jgi:putative endonuclease
VQDDRLKTGMEGENLAVRFLKKNGYKILERNYRSLLGEIDIIAQEKGALAFVEVKTKKSDSFAPPEWSVNRRKQEKIIRVACQYMNDLEKRGKKFDEYRFDVVAVCYLEEGKKKEVRLFKNAFQLEGRRHFYLSF